MSTPVLLSTTGTIVSLAYQRLEKHVCIQEVPQALRKVVCNFILEEGHLVSLLLSRCDSQKAIVPGTEG